MYVGDGGGSDSLGGALFGHIDTHTVFVASVMKIKLCHSDVTDENRIFSETQISATMLPPLSSRFFPFLRH